MDAIHAFLSLCVTIIVVIIIGLWAIRNPHEVAGIINGIGAFSSGAANWFGTVIGDLQSHKWSTSTHLADHKA